jgi:hypothetical protein
MTLINKGINLEEKEELEEVEERRAMHRDTIPLPTFHTQYNLQKGEFEKELSILKWMDNGIEREMPTLQTS